MSKCETLLLPCTAQAQSGAGGVYARAEQGSRAARQQGSRAAAAALLLPKEGWGGAGRGVHPSAPRVDGPVFCLFVVVFLPLRFYGHVTC